MRVVIILPSKPSALSPIPVRVLCVSVLVCMCVFHNLQREFVTLHCVHLRVGAILHVGVTLRVGLRVDLQFNASAFLLQLRLITLKKCVDLLFNKSAF